MANTAATLQLMLATYEELKRLAAPQPGQVPSQGQQAGQLAVQAQPQPQTSSAVAPPLAGDPPQQPNMDAWLSYMKTHGPGAPLAGHWRARAQHH